MKCYFIDIEECELEFFLFSDEVDEKIKKKLKKIGFPQIWIHYPSNVNDDFKDLGGGVFQQGEFSCSSISLTEPTADASYSITFIESRNSVVLKLNGVFFSVNDPEVYKDDAETLALLSQTEGIIQVITLNNDKGKPIKKAKDEWGMAAPIEALSIDTEYNGKGSKIIFKIFAKNGIYQNGSITAE